MKLKILPPTLRKNKRYLTLDIKSETRIEKNNLVGIIWDGCIKYYGELGTSNFALWLMRVYEDESVVENYHHYRAILRCQRGYEEQVRACLALVTRYNNNKKINITTIGLSGTVKASIKKYII